MNTPDLTETISGPVYCIRTQRLVIRCWNPPDAPLLEEALNASVEHLRSWMPWAYDEPSPLQFKVDRIRRWRGKFDLGQDFTYGIFNLDETRVLGGTGLHTRLGDRAREIGYWIHVDFINQGLATEVSSALTKVAFEIEQVQRVEIHCESANVRSASVPRKLGYTYEGTLKRRVQFPDGWHDMLIWTLFEDEYPSSPSAQADIQAFDALGRPIPL